jgi:hypothetical protein
LNVDIVEDPIKGLHFSSASRDIVLETDALCWSRSNRRLNFWRSHREVVCAEIRLELFKKNEH